MSIVRGHFGSRAIPYFWCDPDPVSARAKLALVPVSSLAAMAHAEPTTEELAEFKTITDVADWAGLDGEAGDPATPRGSWFAVLGLSPTTKIRVVGFLTEGELEAALTEWHVGDVKAKPGHTAAAGLFVSVCRLMAGTRQTAAATAAEEETRAKEERELRTLEAQTALAAAQAAWRERETAPAAASTGRVVKLQHTVNQVADEECPPLTEEQIAAAFARYEVWTGDPPPEEAEPTEDQLAAVHHLLYVRKAAPYVDFAIFCPHAGRVQRKILLTGMLVAPSGGLMRGELYGPANFEQWQCCYAVFKTVLLMFDAVKPAALDAYEALIRQYYLRYGQRCWALLYQADTRARKELAERVRRKLASEYQEVTAAAQAVGGTVVHPYDPAAPWRSVWKQMPKEYAFWKREVEDPSLMIATHAKDGSAVLSGEAPTVAKPALHMSDAHSSHGIGLGPPLANAHPSPSHPAPPPTKKPRKAMEDKYYNKDANGWTTNRSGVPLCAGFTAGTCTDRPCPQGNAHQCSKCLANDHRASACPGPKGKGGKAGGKGKKWHSKGSK